MSDFDDDFDEEIEIVSRTKIKKEMIELQKLGAKLADLPEKQLLQIPLEEKLQEAIFEYRRIKHREGKRRMLQYIGRLMRTVDAEPIREAYENILDQGRANTQQQHIVEQWRDRLLADDNQQTIEAFIMAHPETDRQHLRQLIRTAQKEISQQKPPATARKLFRYIRDTVE